MLDLCELVHRVVVVVIVRGVKGILGLNPLGLISRLLGGQVNLSI